MSNTDYLQIEPRDRVAQASNASFDAATFEVWGPLLNGGLLIGIEREITLNPSHFADFLQKKQITVLFITTALFNQMAREAQGSFRGLRALLFGGEAVDPDCVRQVLDNNPPQCLLHVYGPTESTTFATWYEVKQVDKNSRTVPIGVPIANTQAYILDEHRKAVPVGDAGELFIGGDGIAREYLNQPELTAERFISNPFGDQPGERLYATGDTARYLADGNIEFLGRIDNQVKIHGFRIEPGEIETTLSLHPNVKETVVLAREDEPGKKRLVAYLTVSDTESPPTGADFRSFLKGHLPDYMSPHTFVVLANMPLTPNGKIDRGSLPVPEWGKRGDDKDFVSPQTTEEKKTGRDLL